jgi:predicted AAA+ superfamily ATPase
MIERHISGRVLAALNDTPVVLLHGARQTGKSTLVQWLANTKHPARYLTLDDLGVLSAARGDPAGFLAGTEGPLVLDEVQRAPELFLAIKLAVDRQRRPGRFLLTGSADVMLLPQLAESLAGRMEILTLWPFSQGEINGVQEAFVDAVFSEALPTFGSIRVDLHRRSAELWSRVTRGGYPEIIGRMSEPRRRAWFDSYIATILQRDVQSLANIEGLTLLPRLLSLLAARAGSLLNASELSRTSAIPLTTLKRYLALFETTFLVRSMPAWSSNLAKRLVKAPKLYLSDSGLLAHLRGVTSDAPPEARGPVLENFVVMEICKQIGWSGRQPAMFHFRTQTGQEVDIALEERAGQVVGIEIKASQTVSSRDFQGLRVMSEMLGDRFVRGIVLYTGPETIPFGQNLHAVPLEALWLPTS